MVKQNLRQPDFLHLSREIQHQSINPAIQQSINIGLGGLDIISKTVELTGLNRPFVLATVVSCENPTSAKPGAKAVILEDGTLHGWIGGSCAQPIVLQEAKAALRDGQPKLLKIGVNEAEDFGKQNGVQNYEMTCYSGGAMEIFIEPVFPKTQLILIGNSPDLQALARLGEAVGFKILLFDPEAEKNWFTEGTQLSSSLDFTKLKNLHQAFFVVATHGRYDEDALQKALATEAFYIGLIASKKRAAGIFSYLQTKGITEEDWKRVKAPAGLDIGAKTPEEIAVSILAEIVEHRHRTNPALVESAKTEISQAIEEAIDPVCGMTVNPATARFRTKFRGQEYFFCCAGCLQKFETQPDEYIREQLA